MTGSAVVVHRPSGRVLLRWHDRQQVWLQVGGHADPGETEPFAIALREAREETALTDVAAWPDPARPQMVHAVIVPVPAGRGEPAHEHPHQHVDSIQLVEQRGMRRELSR